MGAAPGWYPDPHGGPNRYWDGLAWHDAVPVTPGPPVPKSGNGWIPLVVVCGTALILGVLVLAIGGGKTKHGTSDGYTAEEARAAVVEVCQDHVRRGLRDPASAQFSEWKAWPAPNSSPPLGLEFHPRDGDEYYSAGGLVNGKNGFGGYAGDEMYGCSAVVTKSGTVRAVANPLDVSPPPTFRQPG